MNSKKKPWEWDDLDIVSIQPGAEKETCFGVSVIARFFFRGSTKPKEEPSDGLWFLVNTIAPWLRDHFTADYCYKGERWSSRVYAEEARILGASVNSRSPFGVEVVIYQRNLFNYEEVARIKGAIQIFCSNHEMSGQRGDRDLWRRPQLWIEAVSALYGVDVDDLLGDRRFRNIIRARHTLIFLLRETLGLPYTRIAEYLGGRDHTTMLHAHTTVRDKILSGEDPDLQTEINRIKRAVLGEALSVESADNTVTIAS